MGSKPTIQTVAQMARVSRGTVDRVLNGRAHVREDVRLRVLELSLIHISEPTRP